MRLRTWILGACAACCAAGLLVISDAIYPRPLWGAKSLIQTAFETHRSSPSVTAKDVTAWAKAGLTAMSVGGSSARGYDDPKLDGYLQRALNTVSNTLNIPITYVNKAKSGQIPTMIAPQFDPLLHSIHPDIVIISWGLLNGISRKIPEDMFQRTIQNEVTLALKSGADVWIVLPPATPATFVGHDVLLEPKYAALEITGARAVHSKHVHVFDLTDAMKAYFKSHHLSYKPYEANNWHPNHAGHILAGKLLAHAILRRAAPLGLTN